MISSPITWYVARAGGVVAYILLTASVVAGITLAGRVRVPGLPRFAVEDVHRFLGLLAAIFVAIHVAGIALDATVPFSVSELVVPFTSGFRPIWTGLGVIALELLIALAVTNRLRSRLPYRVWRSLHAGSFLIWGTATLHGLMSGSDRDQSWMIAVFALSIVAVVGSLRSTRHRVPWRPTAGVFGASRRVRRARQPDTQSRRPSIAARRLDSREVHTGNDAIREPTPRRCPPGPSRTEWDLD